MLQYVFNYMCVPFQHQTPRVPWAQVANSNMSAVRANVLQIIELHTGSGNACLFANQSQLASSSPGGLVLRGLRINIATAIFSRTAITKSIVRIVQLDQWQTSTSGNAEHN